LYKFLGYITVENSQPCQLMEFQRYLFTNSTFNTLASGCF